MPAFREETILTRRHMLRMMALSVGAVAMGGALVACGGDDDDTDAGSSTPDAGTSTTPVGTAAMGASTSATTDASPTTSTSGSGSGMGAGMSSGEIVIAAPGDRHAPDSSLPNIGMTIPNPSIYETLVALTPDFNVEPRLAESWENIGDNTWRFHLREGVTFHDGRPFTAEAVAWTMARVAAAGGRNMLIGEDSVQIVDDLTVDITPMEQNVMLPLQLTSPRDGSIIAPNDVNTDVRNGTGPFREVEYTKDEQHIVEAFADYWGGAPGLQKMTFRYMPDPTTRLLALQAGEVDLIFDVPREAVATITGMNDTELVTSAVGAYSSLSFNIHGASPYELGQDPLIREAVGMAIDRDAIINGGWQGYAEVNNTMVPPGVLRDAASLVEGPTFDPERAAQMLDEGGWVLDGDVRAKDGCELRLTMIVGYPSAEIHRPMPELVQAQLKDIGIAIDIVQTPDSGSYGARLESLEGDLWAEVGNQVDADPAYLPAALYSSPIEGADAGDNAYANAFAPGAAFDAKIAEVRSAATIEEAQIAAAEAMKIMIDEEHIVIPIAGIIRLYGVNSRVQNFTPHPVQFVERWESVTVSAG